MTKTDFPEGIAETLNDIAASLAVLSGRAERAAPDFEVADAYVWEGGSGSLKPVPRVNRVKLSLLKGIDAVSDQLLQNTEQFARGMGANNALLWGARGMGKSSLVKAVHAHVNALGDRDVSALKLIEIHREDIETLPALMKTLAAAQSRFIVFCDDLSFDQGEATYKSLKTILDGGLEGRPANVLFYATSNRRHLMPRDMIDNERATAINPGEAIEEKVSLSDRFGLWLGFHNCDQDTYLAMVRGYAEHFGLTLPEDELRARAIEWAATRGARSGRVAIQFIRQIAGENGQATEIA